MHRDVRLIACAAVLSISCAPEVITLRIPVLDTTRGAIVLVAREPAGGLEAWAVTTPREGPESGSPIKLDLERDTRARVTVVLLERTPAELGLTEGRLARAEPGAPSRALPAGTTFECELERDPCLWVFTPASEASESFLLPAPGRPAECSDPVARTIELDSRSTIHFAVRADGDRVLVATRATGGNELFLVHRDGAVERATISSTSAPAFSAAKWLSDGRLLLAGPRFEVWEAEIGASPLIHIRRLTDAAARVEPSPIHWIETTSPGFISLSLDGALEQLAGTTWTELHRFPAIDGTAFRGGLARSLEGPILAAKSTEDRLITIDGGQVRRESLPVMGAPSAVAAIEGIGTLIGTTRGDVLRRTPNGWEPVGATGTSLMVLAIAPFLDGFVIGGFSRFVAQYRPSTGFCGALAQVAPQDAYFLVPLDGGVIVVAGAGAASYATQASMQPVLTIFSAAE